MKIKLFDNIVKKREIDFIMSNFFFYHYVIKSLLMQSNIKCVNGANRLNLTLAIISRWLNCMYVYVKTFSWNDIAICAYLISKDGSYAIALHSVNRDLERTHLFLYSTKYNNQGEITL